MNAHMPSTPLRCACVLLLVATGCRGSASEVDGYRCDDFVRSSVYYGRSVEDRLAEINSYPIDKQYAVFICGVQHIRPAQWEAAQPFAAHGNETAEFLVRKLPLVRDEATLENIITLVGDMDARGIYKMVKDSDLARALEHAVSGMQNQARKQRAQDALDQLVGE